MKNRFHTMREVIAWMQFVNVDALQELKEFEGALQEFAAGLLATSNGAMALLNEIDASVRSTKDAAEPFDERGAEYARALAEIVTAFGALHRIVQSWGIGGLQDEASEETASPTSESGTNYPSKSN